MQITFHGATGTVTGSKALVEAGSTRIFVDYGMYQGFKQLRLRNWGDDPVPPDSIDAVVLTHAHLDHSGLLPRLVRNGYRGPIHCTSATAALLRVILLDAAHLQEEDARRANRRHYTKHKPALPLYTVHDAEQVLEQLEPMPVNEGFTIGEATVRLIPVGHLLGAASVQLEHGGRRVLFSGDVGRMNDLLMRPPQPFSGADLLVVESTYGNRIHGREDAYDALEEVVNRVCGRGGVLMIPAFAVGRSQAVMFLLAGLRAQGRIPHVPVYLNSPMAIKATKVYAAHPEGHRLDPAQVKAMVGVATYVHTAEESKKLNESKGPMILIAGSGMATGGRILHHLKAFAPNKRNGILLVGFQAGGTRGEAIAAGVESVKIHGEQVPIGAEVFRMHGLSGHADWPEILQWLAGAESPDRVVINHGQPAASDALRIHLRDELGWSAEVAELGRSYSV